MSDADALFNEALSYATDESGWKVAHEKNGNVLYEKPAAGSSFNLYKCVGKIPIPPEKAVNSLWAWDKEKWKAYDSDVTAWEVVDNVNDSTRILYQTNKLPWPLYPRDMVMVQAKKSKDGAYGLILKSTTHEKKPETPSSTQRADVHHSSFIFLPDGEGSKFYRIVHIDPRGVIPASVVNSTSKNMLEGPATLTKFLSKE
eukprot:TRINITY_DN4036_c0_g1_i1.p1 TRINITY_DN4036_c0_g1~~TRINITY_DN4036_c0_g1_i1.p1  ORF type:complete len:200 (-),score=53.15 TRINITY_DN4036_c0_g1_i1:128-727(-)